MGEVWEQKEVQDTYSSAGAEGARLVDQRELRSTMCGPTKGIKMNVRKTLVSTLATIGLVFSGAGAAFADTEADVPVNYGCESTPGSVAVAVDGAIEYAEGDFSGDGATVQVTLDLTCNYSANFKVSAGIGDFTLDGPSTGNPLLSTGFGGEHFRMDNGHVVSIDFVEIPGFTSAPDVQSTVFGGFVTEEDAIVQDDDSITWVPTPWGWFPILGLFQASPGVTVMEWDGSVHFLPLNLTPGTYTAPLTVDLTVN